MNKIILLVPESLGILFKMNILPSNLMNLNLREHRTQRTCMDHEVVGGGRAGRPVKIALLG